MGRKFPLMTGLLAGAAIGSAVTAQPMPGPGMMMQDPFGDGTVARKDAEAQAAARFAAMDTNADGELSADEQRAARPARRGGGEGAGPPPGAGRRGGGGMARMLDSNGDGKITREELMAVSLQSFDTADANHDGQLTKAERDAALEARMNAMMQGAMGGGGD